MGLERLALCLDDATDSDISLSSRAGVLEKVRAGGEAVVVGEGTVLDWPAAN